MSDQFDFAWHDFDVTDIVLDEIGTPVLDLADLSPTSPPQRDFDFSVIEEASEWVGKTCGTCAYFRLGSAWPGYEQWGLDDDDEWVCAPARQSWDEENVFKGYCSRRQCWRQPECNACLDALIWKDDGVGN